MPRKRKDRGISYHYVTIKLGNNLMIDLLFGPVIKFRILLLLDLVGQVVGTDNICNNKGTMHIDPSRLKLLLEMGRIYKLGYFYNQPIWCLRANGLCQKSLIEEDSFIKVFKLTDKLSFGKGIDFC